MSNYKQKKQSIECGFGEKCARSTCTFKHPDNRDVDANLRKVREEQRSKRIGLEERQMEMIRRECYHGDSCHQLSCPYRHSPAWNPTKNQRLVEEKRRQNELRIEQQRQHALNVCCGEEIDRQNEIDKHQWKKHSLSKSCIDDDYQYDEEYFDVQVKTWEKQTMRQIDKW